MRRVVVTVSLLMLSACNDVGGFASLGADIDAPSEVMFAPTATGSQDSQAVTLKNVGGGVLVIHDLEIDGAVFGVEGADALPISLGAQEELLVQVTFSPVNPQPQEGRLTVRSNDPDEPAVAIALLSSTLAPDIDVDPSPVMTFGSVPAGTTVVLPLTVSNVGSAPLTVTGATFGVASSPAFTLAYSFPAVVAPGASIALPLSFTPGVAAGLGGSIAIASDDPDEPTKTIGLVGEGNGDAVPDIAANPAALAFGQVVRFTCSTISLSIDNTGTGTLSVVSITPTPGTSAEYSATPAAFQVNPGASQAVAVSYCPVDTTTDNGSLVIASNDPDENPLVVNVSGVGIPPPVGNANTDIAVEIIWSSNDTDVDTHLIRPGGAFGSSPGDCYYANLNPDWGVAGMTADNPFLDHDDIDGFGPENLNLSLALTGSPYRVSIYYFSDHLNGPTDVTVRVYLNGVMSYTNTLNLSNQQRWDVVDIAWNEATDSGTMTVLNNVVQMFTLTPQSK